MFVTPRPPVLASRRRATSPYGRGEGSKRDCRNLLYPLLVHNPGDGGAQFRDAAALGGRGRQHLREGGLALRERRLGRRDRGGELGGFERIGLGEHDLVADRRLSERVER